MSSIQQVAMASVCLVAAFAFGSYINQSKNDPTSQVESDSPSNLRSLIDNEIAIERIPTSTPWMKPKLAARLPPMPSLPSRDSASQPNFGFDQQQAFGGEIPPPSDLSGRIKPTQNNLENLFSTAPSTTEPAPNTPAFDPSVSGESAMPVFINQNSGNSPNLADSMRAPQRAGRLDDQTSIVANAPVFAVTEVPPQNLPTDPTNQRTLHPLTAPTIGKAPAFPDLSRRSQPYVAAKPTLADRQIDPLPPFKSDRQKQNAQQTTVIREPVAAFKSATPDQFRYSKPQRDDRRNQNDLMPIPNLNQTVTIGDPGGAFGNRDSRYEEPQVTWSNSNKSVTQQNNSAFYPKADRQEQRRVARLPLGLNSDAQSKLTRLRDNTIQKISLNTTRFSEYVVARGDSLQSIANEYFGKPDYYLDIYLANRDRLRYPGDLREGMSIKIPVYQQ